MYVFIFKAVHSKYFLIRENNFSKNRKGQNSDSLCAMWSLTSWAPFRRWGSTFLALHS